jgi:predicted nucleotidyltransferase
MHLDSTSIDSKREKYYELLLREIVLRSSAEFRCEVFLYGSRAWGEVRRASDFDIGIMGLAQADFRIVKRRIEEEVEESIIPHEVDVVDFDQAGERFKTEALRRIAVWKSVSAT